MKKIRIALTGAGWIAKRHAEAAQKLPDVEVVAVVDRYASKCQEFSRQFGIARHYARIEELLNDGGVDAIIVGTPNYLHAPQTIQALGAGIHVMVEKPMAMNARQAAEMVETSRTSQSLLMVAHCFRFDPEIQWLQQQVAEGKLGRIIRTKGYGVHVLWGPSGWFTNKKYSGGGAMADMGVHAVDTARFLLGDPQPVSVYARLGTYYGNYNVDDTGVILVNWDNGAISYIESGWWQPHSDGPQAATQVYGNKGFGQVFPTYFELPNATKQEVERIDPGFLNPRPEDANQSMYDRQMAYFLECVRDKTDPKPGGMEGWINMRIIDAAYESAKKDKLIRLSKEI
jgi:predicted dehydrogenase